MTEKISEEMKFPIEFDTCPVCHSHKRIAGAICKEEIAKNKMGLDTKAFIWVNRTAMSDPKKPSLIFPIITTFYDICAECGTFYCIHAEKNAAMPQMNLRPTKNI